MNDQMIEKRAIAFSIYKDKVYKEQNAGFTVALTPLSMPRKVFKKIIICFLRE